MGPQIICACLSLKTEHKLTQVNDKTDGEE